MTTVSLRPYRQGDGAAFRRLNEAWIDKYFGLEEMDRVLLNDPEKNILAAGGQVYFAVNTSEGIDGETVGCCALIAIQPGVFEIAKMAVSEEYQGAGIGRMLLSHTIRQAAGMGAKRLVLETNRKLPNAIHLYESLGFEHVVPDHPSPYARADTFMKRQL